MASYNKVILAGNLTRMWVERRRGAAGARLHVRLVLLVSGVALTPTSVVAGFSAEIGNTGMIVAFVGALTVIGALFASVFFACLTAASFSLPVFVGVPAATIVVLNGLIAILVSAQFYWRRRRPPRGDAPDPGAPPAAEPFRNEITT